jgi:hypothetical protein
MSNQPITQLTHKEREQILQLAYFGTHKPEQAIALFDYISLIKQQGRAEVLEAIRAFDWRTLSDSQDYKNGARDMKISLLHDLSQPPTKRDE